MLLSWKIFSNLLSFSEHLNLKNHVTYIIYSKWNFTIYSLSSRLRIKKHSLCQCLSRWFRILFFLASYGWHLSYFLSLLVLKFLLPLHSFNWNTAPRLTETANYRLRFKFRHNLINTFFHLRGYMHIYLG